MQHAMTLEELQARLAKDLGPKYKGPKRKVNATLKNLQKAIESDLKEIEEEEKATHQDDFSSSDDFDLDDLDGVKEFKEKIYGYSKKQRFGRRQKKG